MATGPQYIEAWCDRCGEVHAPIDGHRLVVDAIRAHHGLWLCRACHYGHYNECEDERCQSMRLADRHE
jgi:hypothetical protein